jgi:MFS family permease
MKCHAVTHLLVTLLCFARAADAPGDRLAGLPQPWKEPSHQVRGIRRHAEILGAGASGLVHGAETRPVARRAAGISRFGHWFRAADRGKAVAVFMSAISLAMVIGGPVSGALLQLDWLGLEG